MDPLSITAMLAAIPGIFVSCVECYAYIQFGRDFKRDFAFTLSKLEATELRLTRWGKSMGIESPDTKLQWQNYDEEHVVKAYRWLEQIKEAFDCAMEQSARYAQNAEPDDLQVMDSFAEINRAESSLKLLHLSMRKINNSRTEAWKPRKRDRLAWAIYRKGSFEDLVDKLADLVKSLVELFPAVQDIQQQLCMEEVNAIPSASLSLLPDVIGSKDKIFQTTLEAKLEQQGNHFSDINVGERARGQYGTNYGAGEKPGRGIWTRITAGGDSFSHFGDTVGNFQGRTVFDAGQLQPSDKVTADAAIAVTAGTEFGMAKV